MRAKRRWIWSISAALTASLWLTACEPRREEVIDDVDMEQADPDTPPPIVEPVRNDERDQDDAVGHEPPPQDHTDDEPHPGPGS